MKTKISIVFLVLISIYMILFMYNKNNALNNKYMDKDQTRNLLEESKIKWVSLRIDNYIIEGEIETFWDGTSFQLIYSNNTVEQIICSNPDFLCEKSKGKYTVDGLFSRISRSLNNLSQKDNVSRYLYVKFNEKYGYIEEFILDDPMSLEDETTIRITSFETKK
jgi:hypothetical protein